MVYAGTKGYLDEVPLSRIAEFQNAFLAYVDASVPQLRQGLAEKKDLTADIENQLKQALNDFKSKAWKK